MFKISREREPIDWSLALIAFQLVTAGASALYSIYKMNQQRKATRRLHKLRARILAAGPLIESENSPELSKQFLHQAQTLHDKVLSMIDGESDGAVLNDMIDQGLHLLDTAVETAKANHDPEDEKDSSILELYEQMSQWAESSF